MSAEKNEEVLSKLDKSIEEVKNKVLQANGVEPDAKNLDKQWKQLEQQGDKDSQLAQQIQQVQAAEVAKQKLEEGNNKLKEANSQDHNVQHEKHLGEIRQGIQLKKVETKDRSGSNLQMYMEDKAQDMGTKLSAGVCQEVQQVGTQLSQAEMESMGKAKPGEALSPSSAGRDISKEGSTGLGV